MKVKNNIKYIIALFVMSLAFVSCDPDEIEFEIKDSFEVGVNVYSNGYPTHFHISATTKVDVSDVLEGKNISNLEITGVSLKLNNDFKSNATSKAGPFTPGDMLPAKIDAKLVLGGVKKQVFKGDKNLMNEVAQDLELINPISFKELLGTDNKVNVSIVATFPEVYLESANFTLDMVLQVRAITSGN